MNPQIITSCGSRGLLLLAERVQDDKWVVYLSMKDGESWLLDIMAFHVEFGTAPNIPVPGQDHQLGLISMAVALRMQKQMPSCNVRTWREYILATLLVARAYNALNCSSIQVALGLSS